MTIVTFFFHKESYAPILLAAKARKLRKEAGDSSIEVEGKQPADTKTLLMSAIWRPGRMLVRSPIVLGLSLYLAVIYAYLYLLFTTFSTVFPDQYGFDTGILGLAFLGLGVGILFALLVLGRMSDRIQAKLTAKHGEGKPELVQPPHKNF